MGRVAIFLFLFFAVLLVLRLIRVFLAPRLRGSRPRVEGEMVRDPVCGTWVDRRIALAGRKGGEWFPVCSEKCRQSLESA
ncbi:MAG: hypothetical protein M3167_10840 [Acidobacteriota bacterium]|nr:hypothetical protein [Acidobacteriota bacterium]